MRFLQLSHCPLFTLISVLCLACTTTFAQSTLSAERLLKISQKEEGIYLKIAEDPEFYNDSDLQRIIEKLLQSYNSYLLDNPDDVNAYILYGKLLRRTGQNEAAFNAFLKADELDPEIAVVKQQIGTHLAEQGKGKAALTFYLSAVQFEPDTALYHFSLGQLLYEFQGEFMEDELFTRDAIDRETIKAFQKAASLEPDNFDFQMRLGEAYYDQASPDWKAALAHWDGVRKSINNELRLEIIDLHSARVLGKLGRVSEARELAETIEQPSLQFSKQKVLDEIAQW
ncbi:MAG: hypothetical protein ACSHX8_06680 [Opitutaceae bacterium]